MGTSPAGSSVPVVLVQSEGGREGAYQGEKQPAMRRAWRLGGVGKGFGWNRPCLPALSWEFEFGGLGAGPLGCVADAR